MRRVRRPSDQTAALGQPRPLATKQVKADRWVTMLKALAGEHRWDLGRTLLAESLSVSQLGERLKMPLPNVSQHCATRRAAGIMVTERVGKEVRGSSAAAFQAELSRSKNRLDLGCCSFESNSRQRWRRRRLGGTGRFPVRRRWRGGWSALVGERFRHLSELAGGLKYVAHRAGMSYQPPAQ